MLTSKCIGKVPTITDIVDLGSDFAPSEAGEQEHKASTDAVMRGADSVIESDGQPSDHNPSEESAGEEEEEEEGSSDGIDSEDDGIDYGILIPTSAEADAALDEVANQARQQKALGGAIVKLNSKEDGDYRLENHGRNKPYRLETVQKIVTMGDADADIFMERLQIEENWRKGLSAASDAPYRHEPSTLAQSTSSGASGSTSSSADSKVNSAGVPLVFIEKYEKMRAIYLSSPGASAVIGQGAVLKNANDLIKNKNWNIAEIDALLRDIGLLSSTSANTQKAPSGKGKKERAAAGEKSKLDTSKHTVWCQHPVVTIPGHKTYICGKGFAEKYQLQCHEGERPVDPKKRKARQCR